MSKTTEKIILGVLVIAILSISSFFIAGLDSTEKAVETTASNEGISLEDAKNIARTVAEGTITEAVQTRKNGARVYEIELKGGNTETKVLIDPVNGNVLDMVIEEEENEVEDLPITGNALERASTAALSYIGEGRVTDTEIGDEEGFYEIEVTLNNGDEVDVHLDENFNILSVEN